MQLSSDAVALLLLNIKCISQLASRVPQRFIPAASLTTERSKHTDAGRLVSPLAQTLKSQRGINDSRDLRSSLGPLQPSSISMWKLDARREFHMKLLRFVHLLSAMTGL